MYPTERSVVKELLRADAKAEGSTIGVGGWLPTRNREGALDTSISPWFALELARETAPWAYAKGEPFRSIVALELLAALLGVKAFKEDYKVNSNATVTPPGVGDNRGNWYAVSLLQSTRFPLCIVIMELAC